MARFANAVNFLSGTSGTSDFTVASAVQGFMTPALAGMPAGTFKYRAESVDLSQWEEGIGTYTLLSPTTTMARTTVLYNSAGTGSASGQSGAGTKITFTAPPNVGVIQMVDDILGIDQANAWTEAQKTQGRQNLYAAPLDALAYNGLQINGALDIDQVNSGANYTFAAGSVTSQIADGWMVSKTGTNAFTVGAPASVFPGYLAELKLTVTTAQASAGSDAIIIHNRIEGWRFYRAGWGTAAAQPLSIGFWVKSAVNGTMPIVIADGAGGSVTANVTITAAATAQYITATFAAQTTWGGSTTTGLGATIQLYVMVAGTMNIAATNGNTFEITGLVVVPGLDIPSGSHGPQILRPYTEELGLCQRYLEFGNEPIFYLPGQASTTMFIYVPFQIRKRAAPTITLTSWSYYNSGTPTAFGGGLGPNGIYVFGFEVLSGTVANGNGWTNAGSWKADIRI